MSLSKNKRRGANASEEASSNDSRHSIDDINEPKRSKTSKSTKKQHATPSLLTKLISKYEAYKAFIKTEKSQKIIGLCYLLLALFIVVSTISYFFSWQADQDKVLGPFSDFITPNVKVDNWLGKIGAWFGHLLIYNGFGIASILFAPLCAIIGFKKLILSNEHIGFIVLSKWIAIIFWFSFSFSFIYNDSNLLFGGGIGYSLNIQLVNMLGTVGTGSLIVFTLLLYLIINYNITFKLPKFESAHTEDIEKKHHAEKEETIIEVDLAEEETVNPEDLDFEVFHTQPESIENTNTLKAEEVLFEVNSTTQEAVKAEQTEPSTRLNQEIPLDEELKATQLVEQFGVYDPTLDLSHYVFPNVDLMLEYDTSNAKVTNDELVANKNKILSTLKNYGIEIDKISATVGPTVTLYEIIPAAGVRISKIKNLEDDIALSLAALGIRIIAPIPGRGTIGIEVPNQNAEIVPMRNILASEKFQKSTFDLPIALGKTINNEIYITDLAKMPHLLLAGATGQGKSVGLNAVLVSLLYKKHPAQIKFILVDPKKVELTLYNKIERHFLAKLPNSEDAIITDNTKVIHTLNSLCIEMDNRYALLQDAAVRNIKEYNAKFINRKLNPNEGHKYLPYLILVIDEFADLIMTAGKEVEAPIARLAQLARAIGIHLIIATQRPSVNIITGTIKANFPARIAFRVTSKIDSRTILDSGGADQLIGKGDMLLSTGNDLIRIQCAFLDTPEVEKITDFIGTQRAYPSAFLLPEYVGEDGSSLKEEVDLSERDKMFDESAKLVVQFQQGSASFLQRKLKLGYNRAGRIVDQLEAAGIIGGFEGAKAREVLIKDLTQLEEILSRIRK